MAAPASASDAAPSLPAGYTLRHTAPSVDDYLHFRSSAPTLTPITRAQATAALAGAWHTVHVTYQAPSSSSTPSSSSAIPSSSVVAAAASSPPSSGAGVPSNAAEGKDSTDTGTQAEAAPPPPAVAVGMGRVVGDGGWYFALADIVVLAGHQRRGLGDAIVGALLGEVRRRAPGAGAGEPPGPYVSLGAAPGARALYERHGFRDTMPGNMGMGLWLGKEGLQGN